MYFTFALQSVYTLFVFLAYSLKYAFVNGI